MLQKSMAGKLSNRTLDWIDIEVTIVPGQRSSQEKYTTLTKLCAKTVNYYTYTIVTCMGEEMLIVEGKYIVPLYGLYQKLKWDNILDFESSVRELFR